MSQDAVLHESRRRRRRPRGARASRAATRAVRPPAALRPGGMASPSGLTPRRKIQACAAANSGRIDRASRRSCFATAQRKSVRAPPSRSQGTTSERLACSASLLQFAQRSTAAPAGPTIGSRRSEKCRRRWPQLPLCMERAVSVSLLPFTDAGVGRAAIGRWPALTARPRRAWVAAQRERSLPHQCARRVVRLRRSFSRTRWNGSPEILGTMVEALSSRFACDCCSNGRSASAW